MKINDMTRISIFTVLTIVGTRIMIPVPLVPFTLQTLVCMTAGIVLGAKHGAASQALYMLLGLAGLPVFTSGGGIGAIFTPSFGYIIGFIACAWVSGTISSWLKKARGRLTLPGCFAAAFAGVVTAYAFGLIHLYIILNFYMENSSASLFKVLSIGFLSTIGGDIIKAALCAVISVKLEKTGIIKG